MDADDIEEVQDTKGQSKDQSKDLEKVIDLVQEKEIDAAKAKSVQWVVKLV